MRIGFLKKYIKIDLYLGVFVLTPFPGNES